MGEDTKWDEQKIKNKNISCTDTIRGIYESQQKHVQGLDSTQTDLGGVVLGELHGHLVKPSRPIGVLLSRQGRQVARHGKAHITARRGSG